MRVLRTKPAFVAVLAALAIGFTCIGIATNSVVHGQEKQRPTKRVFAKPFIVTGERDHAIAYYKRISTILAFPFLDASDNPKATLDEFLGYLGHASVTALDLQNRDPKELTTKFGNHAFVSRFFAPKIVNYTASEKGPYTPGWRKLVRITPLVGSRADVAGVKHAYVLLNYVQQNPDPFAGNVSKNNQVIIIPKSFRAGVDDSAYFAVFLEAPFVLGLALQNVAFDLPTDGSAKGTEYFVPSSCAQCHGHDGPPGGTDFHKPADDIYRHIRLNYLDTDQWHDAMTLDFAPLPPPSDRVVFDAGTNNVADPAYKAAFSIVRELNAGILEQNLSTPPRGNDFKIAAVRKWLDLHGTSDAPVPFEKRGLEVVRGTVWDFANPDERELVGHLNHYCFRCHSSVRYNVFDKAGVAAAALQFEFRLEADPKESFRMPQGRNLPAKDRQRIIDLAKKVFGL